MVDRGGRPGRRSTCHATKVSRARSPVAVTPPILMAATATDLIPVAGLLAPNGWGLAGTDPCLPPPQWRHGSSERPRRSARAPGPPLSKSGFCAAPPGSRTGPPQPVRRVEDVTDDKGVHRSGDHPATQRGGGRRAGCPVRRPAPGGRGDGSTSAARPGPPGRADGRRGARPSAGRPAGRREVGLPDDGEGGPSEPVVVPAVARVGRYRRETGRADEHGDDTRRPWRTARRPGRRDRGVTVGTPGRRLGWSVQRRVTDGRAVSAARPTRGGRRTTGEWTVRGSPPPAFPLPTRSTQFSTPWTLELGTTSGWKREAVRRRGGGRRGRPPGGRRPRACAGCWTRARSPSSR